MSLPQMSLSGAVIILVIVVIRALGIHKLPKNTFLVLWGIALVRLLVPFSVASGFSVYSLLGRIPPAVEVETVQFQPSPTTTSGMIVTEMPMQPAPVSTAVHPLWIVWLIGLLLCAGFFAVAYVKCRREFQASSPVDNDFAGRWLSEHRIFRTVTIRQSGRISAPLTYGVFRPVILMPKVTDWDDEDALGYVLTHEYVHIRRFDAVTKLLLTAAVCIHWFNPAVWLMYVLANRDLELSCDEAVIRRFGTGNRSAYAMTLIRMEEAHSGLTPLCNNFSKNALEERIVAIMKLKRTSLVALLVAAVLIVGVTTAFATSAKTADNLSTEALDRKLDASDTVMEDSTLMSYVDPQDGKTYYSFDGGKTFEPMTDEEFAARFPTPEVEWWTYDEYKAWLENEKIELQGMIGERAWTSGRGDFVWTQEIVDEAIAMYEEILEDIKRGMLYSKTIDGDPDASLMMSMNPADLWINTHEAIASSADFTQYEPFGLLWDDGEKALYLNGQRVRYFLDGAEVDGFGGTAIYLEYADAELKGDIDVHTVRQRVQNADGSVDFMGPLMGLEQYSQPEFDARTFGAPSLEAETYASAEPAQETVETAELLDAYVPFGLSYELDPATGELSMRWQGKPVHSVYDAEKAVWIANSMRGLYLGPDAVDLEAVYAQGKLTGLRETQDQPITQTAFTLDDGSETASGTSFGEVFEKYVPFGITYVEAEGASGAGNLYYNGQLIDQFSDVSPDGGAFSFTSAQRSNLIAKAVYDNSGKLTGVECVSDSR